MGLASEIGDNCSFTLQMPALLVSTQADRYMHNHSAA